MKRNQFKTILSLLLCICGLSLLASCASSDDITGVYGLPIQMISHEADGTNRNIQLYEGEPTPITYRVTPAQLAPTIATQYSDGLSLIIGRVKNRAENAAISITSVNATDDGLLTVTARHSGFANGLDYALALRLADGLTDYTTTFTPIVLVTVPAKTLSLPVNAEIRSQRQAE